MKEKHFDVFFLGAGKPVSGKKPSALKEIRNGTRAIDWQLHSFESIGNIKFHFLGGYQVSDVTKQYPQLHYTVIPDWQSRSIIHTILQAPLRRIPTIITYADTVFRNEVIAKLAMTDGDVVFAYDGRWKQRYEDRTQDDIATAEVVSIHNGCYQEAEKNQSENNTEVEFTGLIKLSPLVAEYVSNLSEVKVGNTLLDLIKHLAFIGYCIKLIDVDGQWAEFNSPNDIAHFVLGTKADTLARLAPLAKQCHIGEQVTFTVYQWEKKPQHIIARIQKKFPETKLVIRSSSRDEDGWCCSNAGGFDSVLNVDSCVFQELSDAIKTVVDSYRTVGLVESNQILVQPFIQNVKCAGVVFTRTLETGSPYYRVNFDDKTALTDSVTAGVHNELRTVLINRSATNELNKIEPALIPVIQSVKELEELLGFDNLDIEFAIDQTGVVHIFQVRPITVDHNDFEFSDFTVDKYIQQGVNCFSRLQKKSPFILGSRTFFGNMPDWNPAEIIGIRPKPLALSLYQYLITNDVWAIQRAEFGYRDVRPHPLIVSFCGQPYIDIRASLNSFIPAALADDLAEKLVECYLSILAENPELHDKIEFDVAFTIWTPSFTEDAKKRLMPYGFSTEEIAKLGHALLKISKNAINRLSDDIVSVQTLVQRRELLKNSKQSSLEQALTLLDDCRRFGTLAFSHAARAGFIATSFLKSFISRNIITESDLQSFLNGIQTITGELEIDRAAVIQGNLDETVLLDRFGHLRPGTYDAEVLAYWESPERYLLSHTESPTPDKSNKSKFSFSLEAQQIIQNEIWKINEKLDFNVFIKYIEKAIQARELVKFEFTRNLSLALDKLIQYGEKINLKREDITFLNIDEFEQLSLGSLNDFSLQMLIDVRKNNHILSQMIELPQLLFKKSDFFCFERHESQPNFVTTKQVDANIVVWTGQEYEQLDNSIVLIPQADPGYDWLFSQNIVGLVTKYGGANSHMTIRAAEMGLPAAIGIGEQLYERLSHAKKIQIDCANQIIRPIT